MQKSWQYSIDLYTLVHFFPILFILLNSFVKFSSRKNFEEKMVKTWKIKKLNRLSCFQSSLGTTALKLGAKSLTHTSHQIKMLPFCDMEYLLTLFEKFFGLISKEHWKTSKCSILAMSDNLRGVEKSTTLYLDFQKCFAKNKKYFTWPTKVK